MFRCFKACFSPETDQSYHLYETVSQYRRWPLMLVFSVGFWCWLLVLAIGVGFEEIAIFGNCLVSVHILTKNAGASIRDAI